MCMDVFDTLRSSKHHPYSGLSTSASEHIPIKRKFAPDSFEYLIADPPPKRRQSGVENLPTAREIRPKASDGDSPIPTTSMPTTQPKKRGRPSKAEAERKRLEMIARDRGEVIGPSDLLTPKEAKETQQSVKGAGVAGGDMPIAPEPISSQLQASKALTEDKILDLPIDDYLGKKKKGRRAPKSPKVRIHLDKTKTMLIINTGSSSTHSWRRQICSRSTKHAA
jgi:hypothetical protein